MGHEHNGECCGQSESRPQHHSQKHEHHDNIHAIAEHLGGAGCHGACGHPEHTLGMNFLEAQRNLERRLNQEGEDEEADEFGLKKKKNINRYGKLFVNL